MDTELFKKRMGAAFIDLVTIGAVCILLHIPWKILPFPSIVFNVISFFTFIFFGAIVLLKDSPYRIEGFGVCLEHQTPGKKTMGILVTQLDGISPIDHFASVKRNMTLAIPYYWAALLVFLQSMPIPFFKWFIISSFAIVGMLAVVGITAFEIFQIYKDPEGRRWGDKRADTKVIAL
ncbi:MAG: RDD family protein [Candidatus Riflebacteria bacterium]|nr:RDD family protein [Candidatus Riflebacteria bacterium]